ncbi:sulfite reductase, iron-sulfur subunit [Aliarcobacter faecis]|uniref:sulfite reductase n=1 Tax=Aliarcobacter faecis TaxID=1564138 RepID=UPI00047BE6D3|nr:sulfite reductase [Aliarcobacter faecis]QKF72247.1 sulfite reductase, iron-sulfur subunit [Aliarcobacter faecis]
MSYNLNMEKIKSDKSSSDIIADIFYYCVTGERVTKEDLERFKWYGIYANDSEQTFFNLKIPLNLGELNLNQLKTISNILNEFDIEELNFKEGQKLELKNLKLFSLPKIFNLLKEQDLSSFFESGHSIKKVITCPVNGLDKTQIFDVEELANKLNKTFVGNKNFFNLPNSLQFAISGYREGCDAGFTPDVSFNASKNVKDKIVFDVKILDTYIGNITSSQIIPTARAIANIYKDFGPREEQESTNFESFIKNLELINFNNILSSMLDFKIQDPCFINTRIEPKKPRMGINESVKSGYSFIGFKSKSAKISKKDLEKLITSLEEFGATKLKITHKSNIIVLDVPTQNNENLISKLKDIELTF